MNLDSGGGGAAEGGPSGADLVARARDLHCAGRSLDAYRLLLSLGPIEGITGTEGRIVAGRLAASLGGHRLGGVLHYLAWKDDRGHAEARYYATLGFYSRRGPRATFRHMQETKLAEASPQVEADWKALSARILGDFRDFEEAERLMNEALQLAPDSDWLMSERADLLRRADRTMEARAWLEDSWRRVGPWSRPVLWSLATLLADVEETEAALALLDEGLQTVQSGGLLQFKASIELDRGLLVEAAATLERAKQMLPLLDRSARPGFEAQQTYLALLRRDFDSIRRAAAEGARGFAADLVPRLDAAPTHPRRCRLRVPRIRQDHATCAPASFCAITAYWNKPVEQKALSLEISYEGTPGHKERHWAETHGWSVREFRVTWESAQELIDRGFPFTLVTSGAESAHEQVVVGYDEAVGSLLISDPSSPLTASMNAAALFHDQEINGPRGLVIATLDRGRELHSLALPDAALYDLRFRLDRALFGNDREEAGRAFRELRERAPDSIHRLWGQQAIAAYDQNEASFAEFADRLFARFPEASSAIEAKLRALDWAGRSRESLALLETVTGGKDLHPSFLHTYAAVLRSDYREAERVSRLIELSLRIRPTHAPSLLLAAETAWERGARIEALPLFRFASTCAEASEDNAAAYFRAARRLGHTETALGFLRGRARRARGQSQAPFQTLFWQLHDADRGADAFSELERELASSEDAEFACWAADVFGRFGQFGRARELFGRHLARIRPSEGERLWAALHEYEGKPLEARAAWERIVHLEPLAMDAHRSLASLIASTTSPAAAYEYADQACQRFPYHLGLLRLRYQWSDVSEERSEASLRAMLEAAPGDAWLRRELSLFLAGVGRIGEARQELEAARALDPASSSFHAVAGEIESLAGDLEAARESFKKSIAVDVSNAAAIRGLLRASLSLEAGNAALRFVIEAIKNQPRWSDPLFTLYAWMSERWPPETVRFELEAIAAARPDHYETVLVLADHLLSMSLADEALALVREAELRFQELPGLVLREADALAQKGEAEAEWIAVERALRMSPRWAVVVRRHARLLAEAGRAEEARRRLLTAMAQSPFSADLRIQLADLLWKGNERDEALATVERAVVVDPTSRAAWDRFVSWAEVLHRRGEALAALRSLCQSRPGSADLWLLTAQTLRRPEDFDERMRALDRAIALNPRDTEAPDLKAGLLASAGEFDAALEVCRPRFWGQHPPIELRGRAAFVRYQRGEREIAIAAMRAILDEAPGYRWGIDLLLSWLADTPAHQDYLDTAVKFTVLEPLDATAWGHRAAALLAKGEREEACAHLSRAVELDPEYSFAVRRLAETHAALGRSVEARQVLDTSPIGWRDQTVLATRIALACGWTDEKLLRAALSAWLKLEDIDQPFFEESLGAVCRVSPALVEEVYRQVGPEIVSWRAGAAWIGEALENQGWGEAKRRLKVLEPFQAARQGGVYQVLVDPKNRVGLGLWSFRRRHHQDIQEAPLLWAGVGNALLRRNHHSGARRATADWRERVLTRAAEPWMLTNVAEACLRSGHTLEGCEVSRAALLLPRDHATERHEAILAAYGAFGGDLTEIRALIESARRASHGAPRDAFRLGIASAIVDFRLHPSQDVGLRLPAADPTNPESIFLRARALWRVRRSFLGGAFRILRMLLNCGNASGTILYAFLRSRADGAYRPREHGAPPLV